MAAGDLKERPAGCEPGATAHSGTGATVVASRDLVAAGSDRQYCFLFHGRSTEAASNGTAHRVHELWMVTVEDVAGTYTVDAEVIHSGNGTKTVTFSFAMNGNTLEAKCAAASGDATGGCFIGGVGFEKAVGAA